MYKDTLINYTFHIHKYKDKIVKEVKTFKACERKKKWLKTWLKPLKGIINIPTYHLDRLISDLPVVPFER